MSITRAPAPRFGIRYVGAAVIVAVLDIGFAIWYWAIYRDLTTAPKILRSIAAGLLGDQATNGGTGMAVLGGALHLLVALIWTAVMVLGLQRLPAARRLLARPWGPLLLGVPFGMMIWVVMNFVVSPLAHGRATPLSRGSFWAMLAWHAIGVGTPMAWVLRGGRSADGRSVTG